MSTPLRAKGFTLIELMVTLAVLAILLTVGVPSFKEFSVSSTVSTISSDLTSDIGIARSNALQFGGPVTVCPSNDSANCGGSWADGWIIQDRTGTLLRARSSIPDGFTLAPAPANVVFSSSGTVPAAASWTLCKPSYPGRVIAIGLAGRTTTTVKPDC